MSQSQTTTRLVKVYKTRRKADLYLYVDFSEDLARVPESLLERFGLPELALSLTLTPDRPLARASATEVLSAIDENGYFLQMPPADGGVEAVIQRHRPDRSGG
ncbi:MAG: YcgL domain-containing protein [Pseudomonadales bacterium]